MGTSEGGSQIIAESIIVGQDKESATFFTVVIPSVTSPTPKLSVSTQYYITLTNGILDANGESIESYSSSFTTQAASSYTIFVSTDSYTGDLKAAGGSTTTGIAGADNLCSLDSKCSPFSGACKAMIVDDVPATRTANPVLNWVLQPYTKYQNELGLPIGVTGVTGTPIPGDPYVFGFNFENSIGPGLLDVYVWTGITAVNWTTSQSIPSPYSTYSCMNWSVATSIFGSYGNAIYKNSSAISIILYGSCSVQRYLYCAQQ